MRESPCKKNFYIHWQTQAKELRQQGKGQTLENSAKKKNTQYSDWQDFENVWV